MRGHKIINNKGRPQDQRVDSLEQAVNELYEKTADIRADMNTRFDELARGIAERDAEQEARRARQLGRRLRTEELGVAAFLAGVVLTTVGSLV